VVSAPTYGAYFLARSNVVKCIFVDATFAFQLCEGLYETTISFSTLACPKLRLGFQGGVQENVGVIE